MEVKIFWCFGEHTCATLDKNASKFKVLMKSHLFGVRSILSLLLVGNFHLTSCVLRGPF